MAKSSTLSVIDCEPFSSGLNLGGVVNSVEFGLDGVLKCGFFNFCGVLANGDNDDDDDDCEPYDVPCINNDDGEFAFIELDENVSRARPGVGFIFSFCRFSASSKACNILLYMSNAFWAFCSVLENSSFKFSILDFIASSTGISAKLLK